MHLSYDDYITFFNILVDGKFDAFRCYTLLSPHFYRALHDFNKNRKKPLWYFQGVWSPEEELINGEAGADAFTEAITTKFKTEIKRVIQAVHGSLKLDSNPGGATGRQAPLLHVASYGEGITSFTCCILSYSYSLAGCRRMDI